MGVILYSCFHTTKYLKICGTQCCSIILKPFRRTLALSEDFHKVEGVFVRSDSSSIKYMYMYSKGRKEHSVGLLRPSSEKMGPTCSTHYLKSVTCSRTHLYAQSIREKPKFYPRNPNFNFKLLRSNSMASFTSDFEQNCRYVINNFIGEKSRSTLTYMTGTATVSFFRSIIVKL